MRILVTGARDWEDDWTIKQALNPYMVPGNTLVHGACPTGADMWAHTIWTSYELPVEKFPAKWKEFGRAAGPIRNQHMVDTAPDICIAFLVEGSRGTADCVKRARKAGIEVIEYWRD